MRNRLATGQAVEVGRNAPGWAASMVFFFEEGKDFLLYEGITKHKREDMNPSHQRFSADEKFRHSLRSVVNVRANHTLS